MAGCTGGGGGGGAECGGVDGWSKEGSLPRWGVMFLTGALTDRTFTTGRWIRLVAFKFFIDFDVDVGPDWLHLKFLVDFLAFI